MGEFSWKGALMSFGFSFLGSLAGGVGVAALVSYNIASAQVSAYSGGAAASFDAINASLVGISARLDQMNGTLSQHTTVLAEVKSGVALQAKEIAYMRGQLDKTMAAVEGAGINIPAAIKEALMPSDMTTLAAWETVKKEFGVTEGAPLFLQIGGNGIPSPEQ